MHEKEMNDFVKTTTENLLKMLFVICDNFIKDKDDRIEFISNVAFNLAGNVCFNFTNEDYGLKAYVENSKVMMEALQEWFDKALAVKKQELEKDKQ